MKENTFADLMKSAGQALEHAKGKSKVRITALPGSPKRTAARYAQGSNVIVLDPDVAAAYPDASSVNKALRALIRVARPQARRRRRSRT